MTGQADVVVVGAGAAGLTAAKTLVDAGREVIVLEARDRVGGRLLTEQRDGHYVEMGGQWLAPPAFTTLHLGWERYQQPTNAQNLWVDDVVVSTERVGCPAP